MMNRKEELAGMFKALGDPTRLQIVEYLMQGCCKVALDAEGCVRPTDGATVGEVCCYVTGEEKANPRISFHLKELRNSGLITMTRNGKFLLCDIEQEALAKLKDFFAGSQGIIPKENLK